jgi:hypothetical protein
MSFKLSYVKSSYTNKDQLKAAVSNKFIGFSVQGHGRATEDYMNDAIKQNIPVNCGKYNSADIVFVSINGIGYGIQENFDKTTTEVDIVLQSGATIITDNAVNAYRFYNNHIYGESGLRSYLLKTHPSITEMDMNPKPYSMWKLTPNSKSRFLASLKYRFEELENIRNAKQTIESECKAEYTRLRNIRKYRNMPKTEIEKQNRLQELNKYLMLLEKSTISRCKEQYMAMIEKIRNQDPFLSEFEIEVKFNFSGPLMENAPEVFSFNAYSEDMVTQIENINGFEIATDNSPMQSYIPNNNYSIENECWLFYMLCSHCNLNAHAMLSIYCLWADVNVIMTNRYDYLNKTWTKLNKSYNYEAFKKTH